MLCGSIRFRLAFACLILFLNVSGMFAADAPKQKLDFSGSFRDGDLCNLSFRSTRTISYTMRVAGSSQPAVRTEGITVVASGKVRFLKVNASGSPLSLEFSVTELQGVLNGKPYLSLLGGSTVKADLSGTAPLFTLSHTAPSADASASALLGTSAVPARVSLTDEDRCLLSVIFSPARTDRLSDTLGSTVQCVPGGKWPVNTAQLRKTLVARKIQASAADLSGDAGLLGRDKTTGIDSWRVAIHIQSKNIPGYDFRFDATVLIPVDPRVGGAVWINRKAREVVDRRLPSENPLAAGSALEMASSDSTEISLIPVKSKPVSHGFNFF